ncbi:hypothetical protein P3656_20610 [Vibrio parahaemolyticus]|uniref:hypothetical protein n=1 Tax=Vibrio parahaemolyticus TaxID=670 RepID=UPI00146EBC5A|nr:hypothetical protein [Vibrio parahaemolyticus]MDF5024115.1 hypothetical protein [Vibrio parahaemolyticus]MDF5043384.1 hypothetical protein [Vibrio parahaemolyticus]MDF5158825.1 hypothetical protein [Vibrio parahaemolyticus]MDF5163636.1 hypothetical protein [Vibrio parahaemolyticus]MDF5173248.1 hypothetical protein [Vibrio parahaemolyticus]
MARKSNNKQTAVEVDIETNNEEATAQPETEMDKIDATEQVENEAGHEDTSKTQPTEVDHFSNVVLKGKAKKLSPKTTNHVLYEVVLHDEESQLYIRMVGNEGGGLFSRENIRLVDLINTLSEQNIRPFKSTVVKPIFKSSSSSNNSGFLMACCRGLGLIIQSEKSVFLHQLAPDFEQRRDELLSLVDGETKAK